MFTQWKARRAERIKKAAEERDLELFRQGCRLYEHPEKQGGGNWVKHPCTTQMYGNVNGTVVTMKQDYLSASEALYEYVTIQKIDWSEYVEVTDENIEEAVKALKKMID